MDQKELELDDVGLQVRAQFEGKKQETSLLFAALKLKLPNYLKTITINQLREAGCIVDPNIYLSKQAVDYLRAHSAKLTKNEYLREKIEEHIAQHKSQTITHYNNLKRQLPEDILNKRLNELNEEEGNCLALDVSKLRAILDKSPLKN